MIIELWHDRSATQCSHQAFKQEPSLKAVHQRQGYSGGAHSGRGEMPCEHCESLPVHGTSRRMCQPPQRLPWFSSCLSYHGSIIIEPIIIFILFYILHYRNWRHINPNHQLMDPWCRCDGWTQIRCITLSNKLILVGAAGIFNRSVCLLNDWIFLIKWFGCSHILSNQSLCCC